METYCNCKNGQRGLAETYGFTVCLSCRGRYRRLSVDYGPCYDSYEAPRTTYASFREGFAAGLDELMGADGYSVGREDFPDWDSGNRLDIDEVRQRLEGEEEMARVEMWEASDGELFRDEEGYIEHQGRLDRELRVDNYLVERPAANRAQGTRSRKAILDYLEWVDSIATPGEAGGA